MPKRKILLLGFTLILSIFALILFPKKISICTQIDFSKPVHLTTSHFDTQKVESMLENHGEIQLNLKGLLLQGPFPRRRVLIDGESVDLYLAQIKGKIVQHETIQIFRSNSFGYWLNIGNCGYRVYSGHEVIDIF